MAERGAGQRSWPLSPYEVNVSFARTNAAGERANWFGPLTPITPLAPPEVAGRQWDYPAGYNLSTLSRPSSRLPFRRCARSPTVMIFCVLSSRHERIRPRANRGASSRRDNGAHPATDAARIATLKSFFARPDGIHGFADWLRILLEEVFVTDAPALYMSRDRGGQLKALMPLDGATIKPVIDPWGRVPQPYLDGDRLVYPAAYQADSERLSGHRLFGARPDLSAAQSSRQSRLRHEPRRADRDDGKYRLAPAIVSPRLFRRGKYSNSLIGVPETWTPDQIASYQKYWDAYFDGDLGRRRRAKFVPGGVAKTLYEGGEVNLQIPVAGNSDL